MKNPSTLAIVLIITASMVIGFLLGIMPVQTDAPKISIKTDDYWRGFEDSLEFSRDELREEIYREAYQEGYHKATFDIGQ